MTTIDEFIKLQQKIIADQGLDDYLPALVYETRSAIKVNVLEDVPPLSEIEQVARQWAKKAAGRHDFLLSFRCGQREIKVIARENNVVSERVVSV